MAHWRSRQGAFLAAAALLALATGGAVCLGGTHGRAAKLFIAEKNAPPESSVPVPIAPSLPPPLTPYQRNPFLFSSDRAVMDALNDPDILLRRSSVEYLSERADGTRYDGTHAVAQMQQQPDLIPALTRAVRDLPDSDSQQAARLLVVMGPSARAAIPAVCGALARPSYGEGNSRDFVGRANLLNSLVHLCGGPDTLASTLVGLLHDPEPQTRRSVAGAFAYCDDPTFIHMTPPQNAYHWMTPEQDRQWRTQFGGLVIPALAARLDDPMTAVRLASAHSLETLTYPCADAPWNLTLAPLACVLTFPDARLRLTALRTLAYMPVDVSSVVPALRTGLRGNSTERAWALAALCHAAQTNRVRTVNAFLPDLASPVLARRRNAAADISQAATLLWSGDFWPEPPSLSDWLNNSRLFRPLDLPGLTPPEQEAAQKRREAAVLDAQPRLLTALTAAADDPDPAVQQDAGLSLEKIGTWTYAFLGDGGRYREGERVQAQVAAALTQAASSLVPTDPLLAVRLKLLAVKVADGPGMRI